MKKKLMTYWAVKPKDSTSNEFIVQALNSQGVYHDEITLNTGEKLRGVWEVPSHSVITDLMESKRNSNWIFDFAILSKQGNGKWKYTPYLPDLKKKPSPQEIKAAEYAQIAQRRKNISQK